MYELIDSTLKINSSDGVLTVWADDIPDRITELSLTKLEKLFKLWQHLIKEVGDNVTQVLMTDKKKRQEIFNILKLAGFKRYQHFTGNQIKALLFYYNNSHSILWQFHSFYPTLILPKTEDDIDLDYSKYLPDLDPFETAQYYLLQNGSLGLAESMPLSKIMKLFVTKSFINWASNPDNIEKIRFQEFADEVTNNPIDPGDVLKLMRK